MSFATAIRSILQPPSTKSLKSFLCKVYVERELRARRQRNSVINRLQLEIESQTTDLDGVLGVVGKQIREHKIDNRVLAAENEAIDKAQDRLKAAMELTGELEQRTSVETEKFVELEADRAKKVVEAEANLDEAQSTKNHCEAQHRSLREKRKELERRQKAYAKASTTPGCTTRPT